MKVMVWYIFQQDTEVCQDDLKKSLSGYVRRLTPFVWSGKRLGWVTVSSFVIDMFSCSLDTVVPPAFILFMKYSLWLSDAAY